MKRIWGAIALVVTITALMYNNTKASDGSASAEVIATDTPITATITQNVSFGSFYITDDTVTGSIILATDEKIFESDNIDHRGGVSAGIIDITAHPKTLIKISSGETNLVHSASGKTIRYRPYFSEEIGNGLINSIDNGFTGDDGSKRVYLGGVASIPANAAVGAYSGTFTINVVY